MHSLLEFPLLAFDMRPWLADMTLVLVKGTLLLSAAGLLTYALRHSYAVHGLVRGPARAVSVAVSGAADAGLAGCCAACFERR